MIITFVVLQPFDLAIWLTLLFTVIVCMVVWRLSEPTTSCWYIPFFFWTFYLGQSVEFSTKRKALVVLLQILVFMIFVFGNAYQGLITSFMISQPEPSRMKTFDEVLGSDYKVLVGKAFHERMKSNNLYNSAFDQGRIVIDNGLTFFDFANPSADYAVALPCDLAHYLVTTGLAPNFYVMIEKICPYYVQLQTVYLSKFLKQWQLIMDWSFEAGLPTAWERFIADQSTTKSVVEEERDDILKLGDISVGFYALLIGCLLGCISLICEIFWNGFVEPYSQRRKFLRENQGARKGTRKKLRVRRIQVRPAQGEGIQALNKVSEETEKSDE